METIANMIRKNGRELQLLLLAGGFVITLGELILLGHTKGIQLVAVASTVVGALLALWGLAAKGGMRNMVALLFVLLALTGLIGTLEHLEREGESGEASVPTQIVNANQGKVVNISFRAQEEGEEGEAGEAGEAGESAGNSSAEGTERAGSEGGEAAPPPLAPLSLSGLALLGAITVLGSKQED